MVSEAEQESAKVRGVDQRKRVIEGKGRETHRGRNGEQSGSEEESYRGKDSKLN